MKKKSIKELNLNVGSDPSSNIMSKVPNFMTNGGFHSNADSVIAQRMTMVSKDDEDSDEEDSVAEDILEFRVYRNNRYQLCETLERIDEGILQTIADIAKAVPGLDQIVGDIELYFQAGNVKEAFDGLSKIIGSLKHVAGLSGLGIIGTQQQFNELLEAFMTASEEDKLLLKEGVEELLEILKQMTITAIQTFDSVIALPSFAGTPVAGAVGEVIANVATTLGTFLRDQPVEQFVFKTISARTGIIAKIVEIFESVLGVANSANPVSKSLQYIVEKISKTGGDIIKIFLLQPFELFRRLADLYKVSLGETVEIEQSEPTEPTVNEPPHAGDAKVTSAGPQAFAKSQPIENETPTSTFELAESHKPYSILFLLEELEKNKKDEEAFEEIDLEEISVAAVGGYAVPQPGPNPNKPKSKQKDHHRMFEKQKEINEQVERMRILESFHQKTSNRLK